MISTRIARAAARAALLAAAGSLWMPAAVAHVDAADEGRWLAISGGTAPPGLPCPARAPSTHPCCLPHGPAHAPLPAAAGEFEREPMPALAGSGRWPAAPAAVLSACPRTPAAARAGPPLYLLFLQLRN